MNGRCLSVNQTVTQGCRTIQCQQHLNSVGFHIIADGEYSECPCVRVRACVRARARAHTHTFTTTTTTAAAFTSPPNKLTNKQTRKQAIEQTNKPTNQPKQPKTSYSHCILYDVAECKDADNNCHESGEYFPISINNMRVNCTCQVEGLRVQYSCPPIG